MESYLPLLLFLVYALFRMLQGGRRPPPQPVPQGQRDEQQEAVDRIREMFGLEPLEAPAPPPPLPPPSEFRPVTRPVRRPAPPVSAAPATPPVALVQAPREAPHPLAEFLRRPETARQAVIINEVLGKPKALRRP